MRNKAGTHPNVHVAIHLRARELADQAPLTPEQMVLLKAVFSHRSGAADGPRRSPRRGSRGRLRQQL